MARLAFIISAAAHCAPRANCSFYDGDGPSPLFIVVSIIVLTALVIMLNWVRSR